MFANNASEYSSVVSIIDIMQQYTVGVKLYNIEITKISADTLEFEW